MASPAQIAANRVNAQRSTGPQTAAGKAASSRNAELHGLTSKKLALSSEDQAAFDALRVRLYREHDMVTDEQRALIDRYAEARWRLERCRRLETALLDQTISDVQAENPDIHPDKALVALFTDDVHARRLRLFLRYQAAIEREFYRADKALTDYLGARAQARAEEARPQVDWLRSVRGGNDSNASPRACVMIDVDSQSKAELCTRTVPVDNVVSR